MAKIERRLDDLERMLARVADIERVKQLKYLHAQLIDRQDPDSIASHFTENAIWERGPGDIHHGRAQVRDRMAESFEHMKWSQHNVSAVVVEVNDMGTHATGEWDEIECFDWDGHSLMLGTHQSDRYVKVDGEWMFQENRVRAVFGPVPLVIEADGIAGLTAGGSGAEH
jgi:hypothetical protein